MNYEMPKGWFNKAARFEGWDRQGTPPDMGRADKYMRALDAVGARHDIDNIELRRITTISSHAWWACTLSARGSFKSGFNEIMWQGSTAGDAIGGALATLFDEVGGDTVPTWIVTVDGPDHCTHNCKRCGNLILVHPYFMLCGALVHHHRPHCGGDDE